MRDEFLKQTGDRKWDEILKRLENDFLKKKRHRRVFKKRMGDHFLKKKYGRHSLVKDRDRIFKIDRRLEFENNFFCEGFFFFYERGLERYKK